MLRTRLGKGEKETVASIAGPSVVFATSGEGKMKANGESFDVKEGYIFFIGHGVEVELEGHGSNELDLWRAFAE